MHHNLSICEFSSWGIMLEAYIVPIVPRTFAETGMEVCGAIASKKAESNELEACPC